MKIKVVKVIKKPSLSSLSNRIKQCYMELNFAKCKKYLEAMINIYNEENAYLNYLSCLFTLGEYKKFLYKLSKFKEYFDKDINDDFAYLKALALKEVGDVTGSIELLEYCYEELNNYDAGYVLGIFYEDYGEIELASKYYKEFLEHNPDDIPTLLTLGSMHEKNQEDEIAYDYFMKAFETDPTHNGVCYNLGVIFGKMKKYDNAIAMYEEEIKNQPNFSHSYLNLGLLHELNKDFDSAIEVYNLGIENTEDSAFLYYNIGCIHSRLNNLDLAEDYLKKSFEMDPNLIEYAKTDSDLDNYKNNRN